MWKLLFLYYFTFKVEEEVPANKPADVEEGGDADKEKNGEVIENRLIDRLMLTNEQYKDKYLDKLISFMHTIN